MGLHIPYNDTCTSPPCVVCDGVRTQEGRWVRRKKDCEECPGERPSQEENIACYGKELPESAFDYSWRGEPSEEARAFMEDKS
jgi:hypothetical protein